LTFPIPQLKIHQEYAQLGIDADPGKLSIEQPPPTFEMEQIRPQLHIRQPLGRFEIDQDKAWDALALGGNLETMSRIYSMAPQIALKGIQRRVEEGNRLADITNKSNPFAEFASDWQKTFGEFANIAGPASYDNVDVEYIRGDFSIDVVPGRIILNTRVNQPIYDFQRGKLVINMLKYNKVEFTPPSIFTMEV
jgi:hypothetical protein